MFPFLREQIRSFHSLPLSPSLSLYLFYFPSLSLALLFSLNLRLSTLSNGCAGPFCIRDTYHLRVRRPKNRSVSRNNTRCHGHPSTGAHTNVTGTFKRSKVVNVQVGNLEPTLSSESVRSRTRRNPAQIKSLFPLTDFTTDRKQRASSLLNLV